MLAVAGLGLWIGQTSSIGEYGRSLAPVARPETAPAIVAEAAPAPSPLEGIVVALDPGHNAGNAANSQIVNAPVPDGRGGTKACNTVGTSTNDGYPEYAFNWDVADRMRILLEAAGATVLLTGEAGGVGPCVDERGLFPQANGADVMVSIHANGTEDPAARGFFAMFSDPPLNDAQGEPSLSLAESLLAALEEAGFPPSNMVDGALMPRSDLATLNHSERPAVMMELAEFRNPDEAAAVQDPEVRQQYAEALAQGLTAWLAAR